MLLTCILCMVAGIFFLLVFIFTAIFNTVEGAWGERESLTAAVGSCILAILLLPLGIYKCVIGNQVYDKETKVYSLQVSDRFILGVGSGKYYYNLNETDVQAYIASVSASDTTLIQDNNIEYPYLLEHKVKWEESEYFLYVPEDVRLIQYAIK